MKNSAITSVSRSIGFLLLGALLSVPAWPQYLPNQNGEQNPPNQNAPAARIGAINFGQGSASINKSKSAQTPSAPQFWLKARN